MAFSRTTLQLLDAKKASIKSIFHVLFIYLFVIIYTPNKLSKLHRGDAQGKKGTINVCLIINAPKQNMGHFQIRNPERTMASSV